MTTGGADQLSVTLITPSGTFFTPIAKDSLTPEEQGTFAAFVSLFGNNASVTMNNTPDEMSAIYTTATELTPQPAYVIDYNSFTAPQVIAYTNFISLVNSKIPQS